jgi:hypothetical protein
METKVKKSKKFKYHTSFRFTDSKDGSKHSFQTQLYKVGVYGIWDNNAGEQGGYVPSGLVKMEKKMKQLQEEGKIKDLEFGREITVSEETGFWEEVE